MEKQKRNTVAIIDVGDMSVGLRPLTILGAELNEQFLEFMEEQGTVDKFRTKLKELVAEFMEPEIYYETYMPSDDDWEDEE